MQPSTALEVIINISTSNSNTQDINPYSFGQLEEKLRLGFYISKFVLNIRKPQQHICAHNQACGWIMEFYKRCRMQGLTRSKPAGYTFDYLLNIYNCLTFISAEFPVLGLRSLES